MQPVSNACPTITSKHRAIIHVAKTQLAMPDDTYRTVLYAAAGITSTLQLHTLAQFKAIMDEFTTRGFQAIQKTKYNTHPNAPLPGQPDPDWGCTVRQHRHIVSLWKHRARYPTEHALIAFIHRTAHVSHPRFLTPHLASQVIVAIQKL